MVGNNSPAPRRPDGAFDPTADPDSSSPSIAKEGHLQYGSSEARYVGSTHWSAILENIQELKTALGTERPSSTDLDESEDVEPQEAETIFGTVGSLSLSQILSQSLPPRLQVDRRLSTYFNSRYLIIPIIHTTQFQRQYEQFWRAPLETPPLWISILFSICCMSATLSEAVGSEPSTPENQASPRMSFLTAACQCLRLGGYIRPKRHVVEALALYAQCKYMATLDPSREVGILFTILVRLVFRSGYHRDPSQFPHFSVFEGEMRRRTWAMCRQFDLMISFQLGLPNQIPPHSWDTLPPRNLLDTDFDEHTTTLPPSRPETEATQILYFIVKSRLMTSFGKICSLALSFRDSTQQEIMDLDAEVRAVYSTVPDVLRIKPMSQSFADPSYLVMVRLNCEFLFQKSICVLHRKYMTQGGYPASTKACTDAAAAITRHMLDFHKEFQSGGQLFADRWMLSSFTMNDFYLASMVLCLGLSMWKKANPAKEVSEDVKMESQYDLLKSAFAICEELSPTSTEAKRVAGVLSVVLSQLGTGILTPSFKGSISQVQPTRANSKPQSILQTSRFGGSTFFPTPYDFNLTSLTISDSQQQGTGVDISMTSSSSSIQIGGRPNQIPPDVFFGTSNPNQSAAVGPNPFTSFLPFPLYLQNESESADSASSTNPRSSDYTGNNAHANPNPNLNMDIDWAFLDQWMALPDLDTIPQNDAPAFQNPNRDFGTEPNSNSYHTASGVKPTQPIAAGLGVAAAGAGDLGPEWTSMPYKFLDGEILMGTERAREDPKRQHGAEAHTQNDSNMPVDGHPATSRQQSKASATGHARSQFIGY